MRYEIVKFESDYGPAVYRLRLLGFLGWRRWVTGPDGKQLRFETKQDAHEHMNRLPGTHPSKAKSAACSTPSVPCRPACSS